MLASPCESQLERFTAAVAKAATQMSIEQSQTATAVQALQRCPTMLRFEACLVMGQVLIGSHNTYAG